MKTIYLNCRFLTQEITGVQRFAFELCKGLDSLIKDYPNYQFIGLMPNAPVNTQYQSYQFQNIVIKPCGYLKGHLWEQLELPFYSFGHRLINFCNTLALLKFKQDVTIHDVIFLTSLDSQKWWFKLWYRVLAYKAKYHAAKIFTVSEFSKTEIIQRLGICQSRVIVLGNAPSLNEVAENSMVLINNNLKPQEYFLMIGSNSKRKNTGLVANLFASQLTSKKLVIVGGEYINLGEVKPIIADNIIYTGYISDEELKSLYLNAKALIFPSFYEGFGIPVIEAISLGLPVLVSDIPVMHEICGAAGLYFEPSSIVSLKKQIIYLEENLVLIKRELAEKLSQLNKYTWKNFAKELLLSYNNKLY